MSKKAIRRSVASAFVVVVSLCSVPSARAVRIMVYNTLGFPGGATPANRLLAFQNIATDAAPDMILAVEMSSITNAVSFLVDVLNVIDPGQWTMSPFVSQGGLSVVVYYKLPVFDDLGGAVNITGDPRDSRRWHFRLDGYTSSEASFFPIGMHLKAGSTASDISRRTTTATNLRGSSNAFFAPTERWFYCGDLNLKNSGEGAYVALTANQADNDGQGIDPFNPALIFENWNNNSAFRILHTQSTRTGNLGDGGATGGLDDRFDLFLMSSTLSGTTGLSLIPGTYKAYGNDSRHFNLDINASPTNTAVGQALADDLHIASDHLPVLIDLQIPAKISADQTVLDYGSVPLGTPAELSLSISNAAVLADPEVLSYSLTAPAGFSAPTGNFTHIVGSPGNIHLIAMDTTTTGLKSGTLQVLSNDVDVPILNITVMGQVVPGALGDLSGNGTVGVEDIPLFVTLLLDPAAATQADRDTADMNGDTLNNGDDIQLLVSAMVP